MRTALSLTILPLAITADGATLEVKARESRCVGKPVVVSGDLYKCTTAIESEAFFTALNISITNRRAPASLNIGMTSSRCAQSGDAHKKCTAPALRARSKSNGFTIALTSTSKTEG